MICGAAVLASFAPFGSPGLDFVGDWPQEYRDEVDLFFTDPGLAREHWRADAESILATCSDARGWMTRWGETAGDKSHSSDLAEHLAAEVRDALADGDDGWWDDWAATLNPWGFDLGDIRAPVHLWHGTADRNVPVANGRWLAEHVPGITAEFPEGQDHTTIEDVARRDAYAWLRSTF